MNGLSKDINKLKNYFCDQSLRSLQSIFEESNDRIHETADLNERLLSVLQSEKSRIWWHSSPDGKNHIVIDDNLCFLVNIHGFIILMANWLFFEGELDITDVQWIETDNLVLFDAYYIVRDIHQKGICHYSNDNNCFVFFSDIWQGPRNTQKTDSIQEDPRDMWS